MLLGSFFLIDSIHSGAQSHIFEVTLMPEHPLYEGHFPGLPIVPGVCSLQMVKECATQITHSALRFENISQCKFQALMVPGQHQKLTIEVSLTPQESPKYQLKATVKNTEQSFLTLKATLNAL